MQLIERSSILQKFVHVEVEAESLVFLLILNMEAALEALELLEVLRAHS